MNRSAFRVMVAAGVLLLTRPVRAHHSLTSTFNELEPVTVTGVVAEVRIENPHIVFLVDVTEETGSVTRWSFEGSAPTAAVRGGYRRDSVKVGAKVTIRGAHARDESLSMGVAGEIILDDGRSFVVGPKGLASQRDSPRITSSPAGSDTRPR